MSNNESKTRSASTPDPISDVETVDMTASDAVPVVGIGASAGGIEALIQFFDAMPADSGAAFVVVLHLDPTRESQLSAILERHTAMPVAEIEDGIKVVANHVYVIAPNCDLTLEGDVLRLTESDLPRGHRHQWHPGFEGNQGRRRPDFGAKPGDRAV